MQQLVFGQPSPTMSHGIPLRGIAVVTDGSFEWLWYDEIPVDLVPWNLPGARPDIHVSSSPSRSIGVYHLTTRREEAMLVSDEIWPLDEETRQAVMRAVLAAFDRQPEW